MNDNFSGILDREEDTLPVWAEGYITHTNIGKGKDQLVGLQIVELNPLVR